MFVRHAEVYNPKDILYGRLPGFRLSENGRRQAHRTGRFISGRPVSVIYTSPLARARETAEILSGYQPSAPVQISRRLIEVRTSYQGSPNSILKPGFSFFEPVRDPNDETMQGIFDRLSSFLQAAIQKHGGSTVVAVSHADPISVLWTGLEQRQLTPACMRETVYPARSSVTQVVTRSGKVLSLTYFNAAEVEETKL